MLAPFPGPNANAVDEHDDEASYEGDQQCYSEQAGQLLDAGR
ncbi:hypothetical protein [Amycolatopsis palatopharyngis]|nr:hypothetical protein [Amycolatopsis palatopharyngis]